jgi:adenylate cyclase
MSASLQTWTIGSDATDTELDALREYVPDPIADRIARGGSFETGEREVTVLFVDLHGYTEFAQDLAPADVFGFISQFVEAVSREIRKQQGFIVEFNGDGMMAVFGAPIAQERKEHAALAAARAALEAVASIQLPPEHLGRRIPPMGIGIATGPAFVGKIRSVDRSMWSAVGTTTNLASRLEVLSRDLGAEIVVDAATHEAAGRPDLVAIPQVRIRGLRDPIDLYAQPASGALRRR